MAQMNASQNINQPFESIIEQIETAIEFADTRRVPYTPEQAEKTAYNLILVTGYFTNACCKWNQKTAADKTWTKFKSYFVEEH